MSGLEAFLAGVKPSPVARYQGIVTATAPLSVNVNGNSIPARVIDPLLVGVGDTVAVDLLSSPDGMATAWVLGRLADTGRPGQGTVKTVPPSSPTITVTGTDAVDYTATFVSSYTPTVNDVVLLQWGAGSPIVVGKVGTTAAPPPVVNPTPPPPPVPPPPVVVTGRNSYAASDTSTYSTYGWDTYAGGNDIYQGNWGYGPTTGAWWYAGSPAQLAGRTVTRLRFYLPRRLSAGYFNDVATIVLTATTNRTRPSGNVSTTSPSTNISVAPGWGGGYLDIPLSFAAPLLAGGGLCLTGSTYAGFAGRAKQPSSGSLIIDWSR